LGRIHSIPAPKQCGYDDTTTTTTTTTIGLSLLSSLLVGSSGKKGLLEWSIAEQLELPILHNVSCDWYHGVHELGVARGGKRMRGLGL